MNNKQQPLQILPDILDARHQFIWRTVMPGIIATPGIILFTVTLITTLIHECRMIIKRRPRGFFPIRTHPTNIT